MIIPKIFMLFVNDTLLFKDWLAQIKKSFLRHSANIMLNVQFLLVNRKISSPKLLFSRNTSEKNILLIAFRNRLK